MITRLQNLSRRLRRQPGYQRRLNRLRGGIHLPENKTRSLQGSISNPPLPSQLILPLLQGVGVPATPVVKVGDRVLKGQVIASCESRAMTAVPVHAPTSGTIVQIAPHPIPHPSGLADTCIFLEPDGEDEWLGSCRGGTTDFTSLNVSELLHLIHEAGIAGLGGAGFPTHIKLAGVTHEGSVRQPDTLLINAAECEPYIAADEALMQERAKEILIGARILQHIVQPRSCVIATEDSKPRAVAALLQANANFHNDAFNDIEIVVIPGRYPSGGEKQLINIVTGKEVPRGRRPADIGILCQNVATVYAIYRAIVLGEPLLSRITTVTGDALQNPQNVEVLLGTPIDFLLQYCGLKTDIDMQRLIVGGPLMGFTATTTHLPVIKTSNCVIATTAQEIPLPKPEQDCIRCDHCVPVCPAGLLPQQLLAASKHGQHQQAVDLGIADCIECGACSYVCPSSIPLVQYYRAEKGALREQREKRYRAEHWQHRFEFHQQRVATQQSTQLSRRSKTLSAVAPVAAQGSVSTWEPSTGNVGPLHSHAAETEGAGLLMNAEQAQADIQAAVLRAKARKEKLNKQDSTTINSSADNKGSDA